MADDLKKVANAAESAGKAARIAHQEATAAANTAQSAGEAAKVAHDEATKAANAAQSAGKVAKELKVVTDDHEERISAIEDHLESQPVTSSAPSPVTQPATTAALAATTSLVVPQLRTDGNIPDLPDPVIMVTEGGVAIDRVKRIWLNINQLQENKCDLDATKTNEWSTPTPIRQASIPQRRPEPLHRTPTRAEIEEEDRRQLFKPYDEERSCSVEQKEKPEKKQKDERNWDRIAITSAVVVLLAAIIYAISASINRTPAPAPQPTTTIVTSSIQSLSVQKTESKQWTVSYPTNQLWVDTGIAVQIGQQVSISVSGTFLNGKYGNQISPEGIGGSSDSGVDPIPGVPMLTSVAKINNGCNGCPINIGCSATFVADSTGNLCLGTADDYPSDNQGNRIATITIK